MIFSFLRNNPSCGFIYNDFRLFVFFLSSMYDTYIISKVLCDIYNIEYFALAVDSNTFKSSVHGIILGLPVPYGVPHGSLSGPIVSGQEVTYTNTLYVSPAYPKVKYYLYYCMYSTCIIKRFITHTCCFSVYLYLTILLSWNPKSYL